MHQKEYIYKLLKQFEEHLTWDEVVAENPEMVPDEDGNLHFVNGVCIPPASEAVKKEDVSLRACLAHQSQGHELSDECKRAIAQYSRKLPGNRPTAGVEPTTPKAPAEQATNGYKGPSPTFNEFYWKAKGAATLDKNGDTGYLLASYIPKNIWSAMFYNGYISKTRDNKAWCFTAKSVKEFETDVAREPEKPPQAPEAPKPPQTPAPPSETPTVMPEYMKNVLVQQIPKAFIFEETNYYLDDVLDTVEVVVRPKPGYAGIDQRMKYLTDYKLAARSDVGYVLTPEGQKFYKDNGIGFDKMPDVREFDKKPPTPPSAPLDGLTPENYNILRVLMPDRFFLSRQKTFQDDKETGETYYVTPTKKDDDAVTVFVLLMDNGYMEREAEQYKLTERGVKGLIPSISSGELKVRIQDIPPVKHTTASAVPNPVPAPIIDVRTVKKPEIKTLQDAKRYLSTKLGHKNVFVDSFTPEAMESICTAIDKVVNDWPGIEKHIKVFGNMRDVFRFSGSGKRGSKNYYGFYYPTCKGLAMNDRWTNDLAAYVATFESDVKNKYHPPVDVGPVTATSYHELGHALDDFLNIRGTAEFQTMYRNYAHMGRNYVKERLSSYATDKANGSEFIAESLCEYYSSKQPRPMCLEAVKLFKKLYKDKTGVALG